MQICILELLLVDVDTHMADMLQRAETKVPLVSVQEIVDIAILHQLPRDFQCTIACFHQFTEYFTSHRFGLVIVLSDTVVLVRQFPGNTTRIGSEQSESMRKMVSPITNS